jgi:23S rRNA (guanosine2251-2'-O)-methyltransferase
MVAGRNAVMEALHNPNIVQRLYVAKDSKAKGADEAIALARAGKIPFDFVPQAKLNELAGTREHQGIAAKITPIAYTPLETCLAQCGASATLIALDQIQHPKNLGMIVRTAAAAGASGVLVPTRGGAAPSHEVLRASAGMLFRVPLVKCGNLSQTLRQLRDAGFWVYGLDAAGDESVFDIKWPDRRVLVIGNESGGIRPGVRKACDALVRIPLAEGVESLNAAVAAGIVMFQAR